MEDSSLSGQCEWMCPDDMAPPRPQPAALRQEPLGRNWAPRFPGGVGARPQPGFWTRLI